MANQKKTRSDKVLPGHQKKEPLPGKKPGRVEKGAADVPRPRPKPTLKPKPESKPESKPKPESTPESKPENKQ
ncbi:MAG: hypothetical protein OXH39_24735 [Candidatus Poribacteria bacterium]|nr:hypothetical protein [Candidatus Poribacteria bacterium]